MTEKSSLTASAVASKLDANVNFIQGPCRAAGINAFKAQCIPPAQLVVLICAFYPKKRSIFFMAAAVRCEDGGLCRLACHGASVLITV